MGEMILEVSHLSVRFGPQAVVDDVSFSLDAETDTALVGPNGAGKSTLVQAVLGLIPRQGGSVRLLGQPLGTHGHVPSGVRDQIAYLPQQFVPKGRLPLTVAEFVALGWTPSQPSCPLSLSRARRRERREAVAAALALCGCEALAAALLSDLSVGQLKRVLLAFCVVRPRRLLLLDEAHSGLDVQASEQFHQLLLELKRSQHWTILQVSHDLEMVRRSCDRVLCLNRSLRCSGAPEQALAPAELERLYGRGYVAYHHHHHHQPVQP